jgi:hypothetical protein
MGTRSFSRRRSALNHSGPYRGTSLSPLCWVMVCLLGNGQRKRGEGFIPCTHCSAISRARGYCRARSSSLTAS